MPHPRKPSHLKSISGSRQPDIGVVVNLPLVAELPDPPAWMASPYAIEEWDRVAPILFANKLLTEAGVTALAHMCALHGAIAQSIAAGVPPTASMVGTLRNMMNDWGLTAVAQGKVSPSGEEPVKNKFTQRGAANRSA